MTKIYWARTVNNKRATCSEYVNDERCTNCPNCSYYTPIVVNEEFWEKIERKIDDFVDGFKGELDNLKRFLRRQRK